MTTTERAQIAARRRGTLLRVLRHRAPKTCADHEHFAFISSEMWATNEHGDYLVTVWTCADCGEETGRQITR